MEETLTKIDKVDLMIMTETLEHLIDPISVLKEVRKKCDWLILSTPNGETSKRNSSPKHLWGWEKEDIRKMLLETGYTPKMSLDMEMRNLVTAAPDIQLWVLN